MTEEDTSGIPTRAIHEAYLDMQRALKQYRQAKDAGSGQELGQAHGEVQESVITFYEMLRPHLKNKDSLQKWWDGKLPPYPQDGSGTVDPEEGKGILQIQERNETFSIDDKDPAEIESLKEWHSALGLNGNTRVIGVRGLGDGVFVSLQMYQLGLRHMDDWETKYITEEKDKGGFMAGKTETVQKRKRVPIDRLKRAARELSDVAEKLGALSDFDVRDKTTEITEEELREVEEWRQKQIQD